MNNVVVKRGFAIIGREFDVPAELAYAFISIPSNLPQWALAFRDADEYSALLAFPDGNTLRVPMATKTSPEFGIIDWHLSLPNDFQDVVRSRVYSLSGQRCVYELSFGERPVANDVMLEAMEEQARLVEQEFENLSRIFARGDAL